MRYRALPVPLGRGDGVPPPQEQGCSQLRVRSIQRRLDLPGHARKSAPGLAIA